MIQIYLHKIQCNAETNEVGADEPYVLVTTVDLAAAVRVSGFPVPLPAFEVVKYGPFQDVDQNENHYTNEWLSAPSITRSFWGVAGGRANLSDPEKVIFVVGLMESDDGDSEALRGIVKGVVGGSVLGSLSLDRASRVAALVRDINSAMGTPTGGPNFDEKVGGPQELRFTRDELARAERGELVSRTLVARGDGGQYTMTFHAINDFGVFGAIREKWLEFGGPGGRLATPTSGEIPAFDGTGRFMNFLGGVISWHPATGAHIVLGSILARWLNIGRERFGFPITDELATPDGRGRFNHFRAVHLGGKPEASIYWLPETGAHEVYGAIRQHWAKRGWERSRFGYPISAERDQDGGRIQQFQGGSLFWTSSGGVIEK